MKRLMIIYLGATLLLSCALLPEYSPAARPTSTPAIWLDPTRIPISEPTSTAITPSSHTAVPEPTPTVLQLFFGGEGAKVEGPIELRAGGLYVAYRHDGEHFWSVDLKDPTGQTVAYITTDIGPAEGSTLERIYQTGSYFLEIEAQEGAIWTISLSQ